MKVCLSYKQIGIYLETAQEISFDYYNRDKIVETYERYPDKMMILICSYSSYETLDWTDIKNISYLINDNLILGLDTIEECRLAKANDLKFFFNKPIKTFLDLNAIVNLGSYYVIPGAPLFFKMDVLKKRDIKLRVIPNLPLLDTFLFSDGVLGSWIRPEDIDAYAPYIEAIEFYTADSEDPLAKERGLYRVYCKDKVWLEELKFLITDLNYDGNNGFIDSKFSQIRLNCGQRCQKGIGCNICYQMLDIAKPKLIKEYLEDIEEDDDWDEDDDDEWDDEDFD